MTVKARLTMATLLTMWCGGCCNSHVSGEHPPIPNTPMNLIFDKAPLQAIAYDSRRSDWPATVSGYRLPETLAYRETILDYQGRSGIHSETPYRRFESVRIGKAIRY